MNTPSYFQYWAKAHKAEDGKELQYHLLPYHLLDVAAVGYTLLEQDTRLRKKLASLCGMNEDVFQLWITFMLGLHDIGKFSHTFQNLNIKVANELTGTENKSTYYKYRHDVLGFALVELLQERDLLNQEHDLLRQTHLLPSNSSDAVNNTWKSVIFGHHGKSVSLEELNQIIKLEGRMEFKTNDFTAATSFIQDLADILIKNAKPQITDGLNSVVPPIPNHVTWYLSGFIVLCDWLGSNNDYFRFYPSSYPHSNNISLEKYWFDVALPTAKKSILKHNIIPCRSAGAETFETFFGFQASPLQSVVESISPSESTLYIIEDQTGSGKTESAFVLANRIMANGLAEGVYIALPTMATTDAMYERMKLHYVKLFEDSCIPSLSLSHSSSKLNTSYVDSMIPPENWAESEDAILEKDDPSVNSFCNKWFADDRKRSALADVGIGTIDQILLAVLGNKYQSLRLFGLSRKVLVVDEVHANDTYMHRVLCEVLRFHASIGGSVILLSATLPNSMKRELVKSYNEGKKLQSPITLNEEQLNHIEQKAYPLLTVANSNLTSISVQTQPEHKRSIVCIFLRSEDEVLKVIVEESKTGCVLWIRNTVTDAMKAYDDLCKSGLIPEDQITLFHARFALGDRFRIGESVIATVGKKSNGEGRKGKVVIATQVVEQSLDVDFDCIITDLAPMDCIIQRAGRLCRHKRDIHGTVYPNNLGVDNRKPILYILSPGLQAPIFADWYSSMFPNGKYVYPDTAILWRTAMELEERKQLRTPDDSRTLINNVFDSDSQPEGNPFDRSIDKVDSTNMAKKKTALSNVISFKYGYQNPYQSWSPNEDTVSPSRLIDQPTTTVRLAKYDSGTGNVIPWFSDESLQKAWRQSEVSIRAIHAQSEDIPKSLIHAADAAKNLMTDKGKFSVLIVLQEITDEKGNLVWQGTALDGNGQTKYIFYSEKMGLTWKKL